MSTVREDTGARGRSAVERRITMLRAQIGEDLTALRGSWHRGWPWPERASRSPAAQLGGLMRAIPAWTAGILAGLLASAVMARRAQLSRDDHRPTNEPAARGRR